jgi:glycosyltransferase involved in cell wall biosynthesis
VTEDSSSVSTTRALTIALIIPAHNEAAAIGAVLCAIPPHIVNSVIVVDNASTDGTGDVARAMGARVVREEQPGYGSACRAGLAASAGHDIVVFLDGDRSDDPADLPKVLAPVLNGTADLVIGSRRGPGVAAGAIPTHQRFGNLVATTMIWILYRRHLRDIGSFRAIRRTALVQLDMQHPTYGWPVEMVVKATRAGYRIQEVPITYHQRIGVSKVGGTLGGSLRAGFAMVITILHYRHAR